MVSNIRRDVSNLKHYIKLPKIKKKNQCKKFTVNSFEIPSTQPNSSVCFTHLVNSIVRQKPQNFEFIVFQLLMENSKKRRKNYKLSCRLIIEALKESS